MNSTGKQLTTGVFYTAIAKYAGILVSLAVMGVLARVPTISQADFGVMAIATVIITFFGIFSDLGIAPAVIQYRDLKKKDLSHIFSFTVWSGAILAGLFFACSWLVAGYYEEPALLHICQWLSINLFFASANIVPNALLYKAKRFRFIAFRTLAVQTVCGTAAIIAALYGMGIYALVIAPIGSSILLFAVNFRQNPQQLRLTWGAESIRKIFSFSMYQFFFNLINYFSRNLDKLLIGKYMNMTLLGYYEKSYRLMMLPLQNITHVISPVMHPVFADLQNDLKRLSDSYLKVVRILAFIGFPLSVLLFFGAREIVLIVFGDRWEPSVPVFQILALSVGIQIVLSTSGSIFQAANSTRTMFISGVLSTVLNVAGIALGIFVFQSLDAVAWCICISFTANFVQCYYLLYYKALRLSWAPFWKQFLSPFGLTALLSAILYFAGMGLSGIPLIGSLAVKGTIFLIVGLGYIQWTGEYDIIGRIRRKLKKEP